MLENHAAYGRPHLFSLCRMAWVDNLKRVGGCALHTGTSTWPAVTRRGVRTSKVDVISGLKCYVCGYFKLIKLGISLL